MAHTERQKLSGARMARRGIWFFMRTVLLAVLLVALCYGVFTTAMRASNLYILATEGLELRAECILQDGAQVELREYFTEAFLEKDTALSHTVYEDYTITNFDYRIEVEGVSVWPWSQTATVTVIERMAAMTGTLNEDKKPEGTAEDAEHPLPEWQPGRYLLRFRLKDDRWYIYQMQLLKTVASEEPKRTPDMRMSPMPVPTATAPVAQ